MSRGWAKRLHTYDASPTGYGVTEYGADEVAVAKFGRFSERQRFRTPNSVDRQHREAALSAFANRATDDELGHEANAVGFREIDPAIIGADW